MDCQQGEKMPSTSTSNQRRKAEKSKFVRKPKQRWQVKQPTRNWLELPSDIMANILYRVGVYDILENAQKVCTTWRRICKDPAMWRVISMDNHGDLCTEPVLREMCRNAVDRSQGQLLHLTLTDLVDYRLLHYVAERSSQLKRLEIFECHRRVCEPWCDVLKKFPLLEELSLHTKFIWLVQLSLDNKNILLKEDIEAAGRYCPLLKTLRVNNNQQKLYEFEDDESITSKNAMAIAIGKNLPALRHLELIGNKMTNIGLKAILDGCCHLETLDLRKCLNIDLKGDMGEEVVKKIKNLKLPDDYHEDLHLSEYLVEPRDVSSDSGFNLDDYDEVTASGNEGSSDLEDIPCLCLSSMLCKSCTWSQVQPAFWLWS